MTEEARRRLAEIETMPVSRLREVYREVFGDPARSNNRRWLFKRIAWRLQAQSEPPLSERARRLAERLASDADARVRPPRDWVVQPPPASLPRVTGSMVAARDDRLPVAGTVLVRQFKGREHRVLVLERGFEHEGRAYRSLSAIAHAITGSHWNGFHFFGLPAGKRRATASAEASS